MTDCSITSHPIQSLPYRPRVRLTGPELQTTPTSCQTTPTSVKATANLPPGRQLLTAHAFTTRISTSPSTTGPSCASMVHSRTSTLRSNTSSATLHPSPPPRSPAKHATHERPAHQRRKSGPLAVSDRKAPRPAPLNRRTTPQFVTKVGLGWSGGSSTGKSEKDALGLEDADLHGEPFLQYCPTCEKQLDPNEKLSTLYCSPACCKQDVQPTSIITSTTYTPKYHWYPSSSSSQAQISPPISPYFRGSHFESIDFNRDIVPQMSPTQITSRPRSYFKSAPHPNNSPPSPASEHLSLKSPVTTSSTDLATSTSAKRQSGSSTAYESLSEIATRERDTRRYSRLLRGDKDTKRSSQESPPSTSISTTASMSSPPTPLTNSGTGGVWTYLPRTLSMASVYSRDIVSASQAERFPGGINANVSPSSGKSSSSYNGEDQYGAAVKPNLLPAISLGMDRPLPPRSGGYGYGGRPKSVDLVTPVSYI